MNRELCIPALYDKVAIFFFVAEFLQALEQLGRALSLVFPGIGRHMERAKMEAQVLQDESPMDR